MRKKIVAGNWKMNLTLQEGEKLLSEIISKIELTDYVTVIISCPYTHIASLINIRANTPIKLAAQNCSEHVSGAFTGEVSASMLKSVGANYVIVGHSERRQYYNETNSVLLSKIVRVFEADLLPIYCIGENLTERENGKHFDVINQQLKEVLFQLPPHQAKEVVIAYEPVWAIGTGKTASPDEAQEMHSHIRKEIAKQYNSEIADSVHILYGGSCNAQNAASLFSLPDVDGGLIGGASLKADDFIQIIKAAAK